MPITLLSFFAVVLHLPAIQIVLTQIHLKKNCLDQQNVSIGVADTFQQKTPGAYQYNIT